MLLVMQDVDCFVLLLGWAAYAWDTRRHKLTHALRHRSHGSELRRLCNLACCSDTIRMELQHTVSLDSVPDSAQSEARASHQDIWHPACVHIPEIQRCQATDTTGASPGLQPAPVLPYHAPTPHARSAISCAHITHTVMWIVVLSSSLLERF